MTKITTSDFQKGIFIEFKNEPCQIVDFQFVNPGKGSAFVRTKLKNLSTGKVQEFTYKSGETVEELPIFTKEMQYLYKSGDEYYFMDKQTFEQVSLAKSLIGNFSDFLRESETYQILMLGEKPVGMRFPKKVKLKVTEAETGVKGDTVIGAKKTVTLETGAKVVVPIFIKAGDEIFLNPETGEYLERASSA